jgi:hypothetical protein
MKESSTYQKSKSTRNNNDNFKCSIWEVLSQEIPLNSVFSDKKIEAQKDKKKKKKKRKLRFRIFQ